MGACCDFVPVDPEVKEILKILDDKYEDLIKTFLIEEKETKDKQEKQLKKRHDKLEEKKNKNEEITEKFIKDLNKEELEVEIKILTQEASKLHLLFEIGLDLTKPLRKYTLDKFMAKAKSAPAVALKKLNEQIDEIKNFPAVKFLKSSYGKPLMTAMEKKGLSDTVLQSFKKELFKLRGNRRKAEREEFNIKVNEFPNENINQIKIDIFSLIVDEYLDSILTFEQYIAKKIIESMEEDKDEENKKEDKKEDKKNDNKGDKKKK
jgi:hypothetical protein